MAFNYTSKLFRVLIGTLEVLQEISFDFGAEREFNELASKDTENVFDPAKKSYTLSGEAYVSNTALAAEQDLFAMMGWLEDGSSKAYSIGDAVSGNVTVSGNAYLKSYSFKSENNGVMTYSFTLQVDGVVTPAKTV